MMEVRAATGRTDRVARMGRDTIAATIILPAYNEAVALPEVLRRLFEVLDNRFEVIVVDDASTDDTAAIAGTYPCRVLRHGRNQGKGAAVRTGLLEAHGEFIVVMDADNTYPAEAVPRMVALSREYDFVRGVRQYGETEMPLVNRIGNKIFDYALRTVHGLEGNDLLSGLYGLRREALNAMDFTADRFDLEVEIGIKARAHRLRATTLPIEYGKRLGEKKLHAWRDGWQILRRTLAMALLYNPGLTFVAPGALLWGFAAILTFILSRGPVETPYVGLSDHSLIVAALGTMVGFQLVVFGIAAALYSVTVCGVPPRLWLLRLSTSRVRLGATALGLALSTSGLLLIVVTSTQWLKSGRGGFQNTGGLVAGGALLLWGTQVVLAALFISIFAGRLETARTSARPAGTRPVAATDYSLTMDVGDSSCAVR